MDLQFSDLDPQKKIYFASDFHLGAPDRISSMEREKKIVRWLTEVSSHAAGIFLAGDLFDFWFEYKHVVPKGYLRFLGKLAEIKDKGIPIIIFTGNHDLWMADYLTRELNIPIIHQPQSFQIGPHIVHIGHGDGLGPGDKKFKFFKKIFTNGLAQWAFRWLHPDLGIWLANKWSDHSRDTCSDPPFKEDEEWLIQYCKEVEAKTHHDFYIFGHRHLAIEAPISTHSTYFNLGEWINGSTYLEMTRDNATLKTFEN